MRAHACSTSLLHATASPLACSKTALHSVRASVCISLFRSAHTRTDKVKPDEIARLYRKMVLAIMELQDLLGAARTSQQDSALSLAVVLFRGHRCVHLAGREAASKAWGAANGLLDLAAEVR